MIGKIVPAVSRICRYDREW